MQVPIRNNHAFTIVELIIVIIVIAVLATVTAVAYNGIQTSARDKALVSDLQAVEAEITRYAVNNSGIYSSVLNWDSLAGSNTNIAFTPTQGNRIIVQTGRTSYCIKAFNTESSSKTEETAQKLEYPVGACAGGSGSGSDPFEIELVGTPHTANAIDTFCEAAANAPAGYNVINGPGFGNVMGTSGNDIIYRASAYGNTYGGGGNDIICMGSVTGNVYGDAGNDILVIVDGMGNLFGGDGNDALISKGHMGNLDGEGGDDILYAHGSLGRAIGGPGTDRLHVNGGTTVPNETIEITF